MIDGDVLILLKRDAVETISQSEDATDDILQFEVRAQHLCIEIVFLHLQLVRIEARVPRTHLVDALVSQFTNFVTLLNGSRFVGIDEVVQQAIDTTCISGHAMLQHIVGISLVTKQLGNLTTQIDNTFADVEIVLRVLMRANGVASHVELLAELKVMKGR